MSITITAVRNPVWKKAISPDTGKEVDVIQCEIQCDRFGNEWLPFGSTPYDTEKHGQNYGKNLMMVFMEK